MMLLTISPVPLLRDHQLRVDANREAEDSQDEECYAQAQNDWDASGRVCKIRLDTWGRLPGRYCLQ